MPRIIPIRDLKNTSDISDRCDTACEPIFYARRIACWRRQNGVRQVRSTGMGAAGLDSAKRPVRSMCFMMVLKMGKKLQPFIL